MKLCSICVLVSCLYLMLDSSLCRLWLNLWNSVCMLLKFSSVGFLVVLCVKLLLFKMIGVVLSVWFWWCSVFIYVLLCLVGCVKLFCRKRL